MSYENFDPNDLLIQAYSTKPEGNFGPHRIPHGIRAIHLPTGTVVACDADRSQHKNRHNALTQLWELVQDKPSYQELAAQVEALNSKNFELTCYRVDVLRCLKTIAFEHNHADVSLYKPMAHQLMDSISANAELKEVRAEAGRDGFIAAYMQSGCRSREFVEAIYGEEADEYAETIRQGGSA